MNFEKVFWIVVLVVLAFLGLIGAYCAIRSISTDGQITYCYVRVYSPNGLIPSYTLEGFIPWRTDKQIGIFATLDDALAGANKMHCPLVRAP